METSTKLKVGVLTSTAVALTCVGVTYYLYLKLRKKYTLLDAAEALKYLIIRTATSEKVCDEVVSEIRRRTKRHRAVGFDCEWVTEQGKRQPVALVQLSTLDGFCGLFRLSHMKTMPKSLKDLLQDKTIYKVGVAPSDDAKYLYQDYLVSLKSTLDIRHLAELCGHSPGGLAALSKSLLEVTLDKSWRVRCSNWAADVLSDRQVMYAAADAHVAIKIFVKLVNEYSSGGVISWLYQTNMDDVWSNLDELCWKYVDVNFKTKQRVKQKFVRVKERRVPKEAEVRNKKDVHITRSKPLYDNCFLQAPDGELLCTSDTKKALWYVEKQIADVVNESPLTVRLRFEPAGRSVGDVGRYYQMKKDNKCVVCGGANTYIRKNVVPKEYRRYFPEIMKEHSSHDVVLMCVECHKKSNMRDQAVRDRLANMCDAPLCRRDWNNYRDDPKLKKIRYAARTLLHQSKKHVLPEARRKELETALLRHLQCSELTEELLRATADMSVIVENIDYESHGAKVVEYFLKREGGLLRLEELWREHFLGSMRPRYMPELWSVNHNEEKLRIKLNEGRLSEEQLKQIGVKNWL